MSHKLSIFHTFFFSSPLEPQSLRICLFIFHHSCDFFLNAFFYMDNKISDRYQYEGDNLYLYSLVNNIVITVCSTLVSYTLRISLKYLINSKRKIENVFREVEKIMIKNKKARLNETKKNKILKNVREIISYLKIKILIFIITEILLMLFFTYYVTVFCSIYKNTQISWLSDSIASFFMSILIELIISMILALLYTVSISKKMKLLYNISIFVYDMGH